MLTDRLNRLVEHGVFERVLYREHPPRYEYRLTEQGRDLFTALNALRQWGDRYLSAKPMRLLRRKADETPVVAALIPEGAAVLPHEELELVPGPGFPKSESTYRSGTVRSTGLMSTTGVPSMASSGPTFSLPGASSSAVTRWRPRGFGRSGDRVANTPVSGRLSSPRGSHLQHVALGLVQPGDDEQLVAQLYALEPFDDRRRQLDPGVRRSLVALTGRRRAVRERRPDDADRVELVGTRSHLDALREEPDAGSP